MSPRALLAVVLAAAVPPLPALAQEEAAPPEPPLMTSEVLASFVAPEANQGIGVDAEFLCAIDNATIAKYRKGTHALVEVRDYADQGALHFDSAAVVDGRIYLAHSDYPTWPITSSLAVVDAETLDRVDSHSFGIQVGSSLVHEPCQRVRAHGIDEGEIERQVRAEERLRGGVEVGEGQGDLILSEGGDAAQERAGVAERVEGRQGSARSKLRARKAKRFPSTFASSRSPRPRRGGRRSPGPGGTRHRPR